jgi:hypothetical protein
MFPNPGARLFAKVLIAFSTPFCTHEKRVVHPLHDPCFILLEHLRVYLRTYQTQTSLTYAASYSIVLSTTAPGC